jgi:DNA helicase-2/ATP-dependent DNA helicase PcrA
MNHILSSLNDEQKAAVTSPSSVPLLLCAGPGSGKTRVLTSRVVWLLRNKANKVSNILALSFSRAACLTFQERLGTMLTPIEQSKVKVCTFHSLCLRLCRQNPSLLGFEGLPSHDTFHLCNSQEQNNYLQEIFTELKINTNDVSTSDILKEINLAKSSSRGPEDYSDQPQFQTIFTLFNRKMSTNNSLSFLDIVVKALHILTNNPSILKQFQQQYNTILCDEFQDTSKLQFSFLTLIGSHKRVTVVCDDCQSIYSFAGSEVENLNYFGLNWNNVVELNLSYNYRSTLNIIFICTKLIQCNRNQREKKMIHASAVAVADEKDTNNERINVVECRTCHIEVDYVIHKIQTLLAAKKYLPSDIAILYRQRKGN